jgi:hypothetical protein
VDLWARCITTAVVMLISIVYLQGFARRPLDSLIAKSTSSEVSDSPDVACAHNHGCKCSVASEPRAAPPKAAHANYRTCVARGWLRLWYVLDAGDMRSSLILLGRASQVHLQVHVCGLGGGRCARQQTQSATAMSTSRAAHDWWRLGGLAYAHASNVHRVPVRGRSVGGGQVQLQHLAMARNVWRPRRCQPEARDAQAHAAANVLRMRCSRDAAPAWRRWTYCGARMPCSTYATGALQQEGQEPDTSLTIGLH